MIDYKALLKEKLQPLKAEHRYRVFTNLERLVGEAPYALWHKGKNSKKVIVWCSNDYLGMSHNPEVIEAFSKAAQKYGTGSGGTRNISGTNYNHVTLEQTVADLHKKDAGLVFVSGYAANEASLCALGEGLENCVILSDEKIHASMIQGIRHSRAERHVFRHNDLADLQTKLASFDSNRPKIIAFVSVYSMDGDIAPIKEICDLAKQYNAFTYLDEVHAVGIYGDKGEGVSGSLGLSHQIDMIQGNFAKAYGVVGGYITSQEDVVDYVRSYASGFIFTTSLPPAVAAAAQKSIEILKSDSSYREKLWENVVLLKDKLSKSSVRFVNSKSHIIPILVGDAYLCRLLAQNLLENYGIYVQPINYPTVPKGQERLRITVTPAHTPQMINELVSALEAEWNALSLKKAA
ncbi:MAG: 5-aminolevulinate synthase [Alphaproteobacteria bacterium]|nr:5-aminolevulinate synthase [Alphaproteobacteria bacterium]